MNGGASQSMMGVFVNGNHQYYIKNGNTNAMNNMGVLLSEQNDFKNTKKYYLMAIEKGNAVAMYNMGVLLEKQKNGITILLQPI
jgi:TPR repeat protein